MTTALGGKDRMYSSVLGPASVLMFASPEDEGVWFAMSVMHCRPIQDRMG